MRANVLSGLRLDSHDKHPLAPLKGGHGHPQDCFVPRNDRGKRGTRLIGQIIGQTDETVKKLYNGVKEFDNYGMMKICK